MMATPKQMDRHHSYIHIDSFTEAMLYQTGHYEYAHAK